MRAALVSRSNTGLFQTLHAAFPIFGRPDARLAFAFEATTELLKESVEVATQPTWRGHSILYDRL